METFSKLLAICAGNSPVPGEFPAQRPVTRSFDVFFDLRLNKRLSKQSWGWWFETPSCPLWRHRNGIRTLYIHMKTWWQGNPPCYWFCVSVIHQLLWFPFTKGCDFDGFVQERCNSSALAMELRLSCTNPSIIWTILWHHFFIYYSKINSALPSGILNYRIKMSTLEYTHFYNSLHW